MHGFPNRLNVMSTHRELSMIELNFEHLFDPRPLIRSKMHPSNAHGALLNANSLFFSEKNWNTNKVLSSSRTTSSLAGCHMFLKIVFITLMFWFFWVIIYVIDLGQSPYSSQLTPLPEIQPPPFPFGLISVILIQCQVVHGHMLRLEGRFFRSLKPTLIVQQPPD